MGSAKAGVGKPEVCLLPGEGLDLAVPQSVMAACYPPHASYKMHLDSYFLQGHSLR